MPDTPSIEDQLEKHCENNHLRMQELVAQQYSVEITRSVVLMFSAPSEDEANTLSRALFAKGMRLLQPAGTKENDGRFHVRASVKRSIRDIVRQEVTEDLIKTAAGINTTYDGWDLLTDDAAEDTQAHSTTPDVQHSPSAAIPTQAPPEHNPQVH